MNTNIRAFIRAAEDFLSSFLKETVMVFSPRQTEDGKIVFPCMVDSTSDKNCMEFQILDTNVVNEIPSFTHGIQAILSYYEEEVDEENELDFVKHKKLIRIPTREEEDF